MVADGRRSTVDDYDCPVVALLDEQFLCVVESSFSGAGPIIWICRMWY